jgi:putative tricarboxylic transport membrane protein
MTNQTANEQASGDRRENAGSPPLVNRTDLGITIVTLAICGGLYGVTTTFDEPSVLLGENMRPEEFPRLLLWFIGFLALGLPFEQYLQQRSGRVAAKRSPGIKLISIITAGLLITIVALMKTLGTSLSMVAVCLLLPLLWGERRLWLVIPFAILFPIAVILLFSGVLGVYFEPGILAGLFG